MSTDPGPAKRTRGSAAKGFWVRAAVTGGVLAILLAVLPLDALMEGMRRVPVSLWLAVWIAFLVGHAVTATKWRLLLRASGAHIDMAATLRAHGAGLFANLCLPSIVGGDVVRAGLGIRAGGSAGAVAVGSLADRVLDTLALTLLAAIGALATPGMQNALAAQVIGVVAAGCGLAAVGGLVTAWVLKPEQLPARLAPLSGILGKVQGALRELASHPGAAISALGLGFAVQAAFVGLNAALGAAVGIELPFAAWLLVWPLAKLVALAPISLGGIGVREAALSMLLLPFGVDAALAVAQSLLWETVLVAGGLAAGAGALALGARPSAFRGAPAAGGEA